MYVLGKVSNGLLGNAILEIGVYTTEGELLSCFLACLLKGIVVEVPIVAVVGLDFYAVLCCILLEGVFGSNCLG